MPSSRRKDKGATSKSDESVSIGQGEEVQLTGVFATDFPVICQQHGLPPIAVRNLEGEPVELPEGIKYWLWAKEEPSDDNSTKKLGRLNIRGWKITLPVITALQTSLRSTVVTNITLWETGLTCETLSILVDLLTQLQCRSVDIGGSSLADPSPVCKLLDTCKSLRELSLRCCNIDDLAVKLLAEALKKDVPLQQLDLSHNNIGSEGACHLASSLRLNRTLLCLSLTDNKIDDVGAMALAEVLKEFPLYHEEIVCRRQLLSQMYKSQWDKLASGSTSLSRVPSSRRSISKAGDREATTKKAVVSGSLAKAASFISKTKKGAESRSTKKLSKGSDGKNTPDITPSRPSSTVPMLQGPLIDGIREEGNDVLCPGNSAIISIALASNQIGVKGLESFVEVLKYQKDTAPLPHGVGLLTVQLQENQFKPYHPAYMELKQYLASRTPTDTPSEDRPTLPEK